MAKGSLPARLLSGIASAVIGLIVLLDMVAGPVLRPIGRFIDQLGPIEHVRRLSRRLPAYVALICLAVPLLVAEPAKIFALYLIGEGHYIAGSLTLAVAYLVSLVLVDTIYDGARPQLRSITWFATLVDRVAAIRLAVMSRVRTSKPYLEGRKIVQRARAWIKMRRMKFVRRQF